MTKREEELKELAELHQRRKDLDEVERRKYDDLKNRHFQLAAEAELEDSRLQKAMTPITTQYKAKLKDESKDLSVQIEDPDSLEAKNLLEAMKKAYKKNFGKDAQVTDEGTKFSFESEKQGIDFFRGFASKGNFVVMNEQKEVLFYAKDGKLWHPDHTEFGANDKVGKGVPLDEFNAERRSMTKSH